MLFLIVLFSVDNLTVINQKCVKCMQIRGMVVWKILFLYFIISYFSVIVKLIVFAVANALVSIFIWRGIIV